MAEAENPDAGQSEDWNKKLEELLNIIPDCGAKKIVLMGIPNMSQAEVKKYYLQLKEILDSLSAIPKSEPEKPS